MPDPIIILGGADPFGRSVADFAVSDEHTLYEWAMVYEDRHPAALHPAHRANTAEDRHHRLEILGGERSIGRAVYDALAAEIEAGCIAPRQCAYCADRPAMLDPTLCTIDKAPVLMLARRRGDYGACIAALLSADAENVAADDAAAYRTGAAGRPGSWYLAQAECRRRYTAGERYPTIADWARELAAWLQAEHPAAPPLTHKTLTNNLSPLLRQLRADSPK
jgi:hypothetical protein